MTKKKKLLVIFLLSVGLSSCTDSIDILKSGTLVPKTVDEDLTLPAIVINGSLLHSEGFGNPLDPLIIVLHGGPGADYRALLNCRELASFGYFVVFYDQRGAGLSMRHPYESFSLQLMYDDLTQIIEHYKSSTDQKVFLLGHSWGAILATGFIGQFPDSIAGAILIEPGGFTLHDINEYVQRKNKLSPFSETVNDVAWIDQFLSGTGDEHAILDYKYFLASVSDGAKDNPIGNEGIPLVWRFGAVAYQALIRHGEKDGFDVTKNLSQFRKKILFVYSEKNKAYGVDWASKVSTPYPNVQLHRVVGAGHDIIAFPTGWQNLLPAVLTYLHQ